MEAPDATPEFPLTITTHRNGDAWTFETPDDLIAALPNFNTDDPSAACSVTEARGRLVRLVIANGAIHAFACVPGWSTFEL